MAVTVLPPTPQQTPGAPIAQAQPSGSIHGIAFVDNNATGKLAADNNRLVNAQVSLSLPSGMTITTFSDGDGGFTFSGLPAGVYHVAVTVPQDWVPTTDAGQDVEVTPGDAPSEVLFGMIGAVAAGLAPDPNADDEQIIALASVTSLPLRFAEGRDLMAQLGTRVLGDGLVWLGVPFRSQMDGGDFQYVNCGPASLTMVLAGFGLEVRPSQVRDYLNNLIDNFDTDLGTSLDVLSRIGSEAGLTPMDLYSDHGGYRNWSTDAVRWHLQQGHPVITLVKYRNLPGHTSSLSSFDHYIVISGLTPNGFIYNDAAFATTLGYGLEISDVELEYAWENSSIPHHAVALGLSPDKKALSFPELPRKPRNASPAVVSSGRNARRLALADEAPRAPLVLTPVITATSAGPLLGERWSDDPNFDLQPPLDPGNPMGLNVEPGDQPELVARPGPGAEVPKLLALIGIPWALWLVWSFGGQIARSLPTTSTIRKLTHRLFRSRRRRARLDAGPSPRAEDSIRA